MIHLFFYYITFDFLEIITNFALSKTHSVFFHLIITITQWLYSSKKVLLK